MTNKGMGFSERRTSVKRSLMLDSQTIRKSNLRTLIGRWGGPSALAKKLKYGGPSYLSQMIRPIAQGGKPVSEKTARYIEKTMKLPQGWMDVVPSGPSSASLINQVVAAVASALHAQGVQLPHARTAEIVSLAYAHALEREGVDDDYIARLIKLVKS